MRNQGQTQVETRERSDTIKSSEDGSVDVSAFENSDNVLGNTSSAVSAMLVGAITNPKAMFWDGSRRERQRQVPAITTEVANDALHAKPPASSLAPSDTFSERNNDTLTAPSDEKSKRHSWSFGWLSSQQQSIKSVPTSPVSTPSIATDQGEVILCDSCLGEFLSRTKLIMHVNRIYFQSRLNNSKSRSRKRADSEAHRRPP